MNQTLPNLQTASRSKHFYRWVLASVVGACLSSLFAQGFFPVLFRLAETTPFITTSGISLLMGCVIGAIAGTCQWFVLKAHFRKAYWWIVTLAFGYVIGGVLMSVVVSPMLQVLSDPAVWDAASWFKNPYAGMVGLALCSGLAVGALQWLFFKSRQVQNAKTWFWVVMISQLLLYLTPHINWVDYVSNISQNDWLLPLIGIISIVRLVLLATIYGCLTGLVLVGFIDQAEQANTSEASSSL